MIRIIADGRGMGIDPTIVGFVTTAQRQDPPRAGTKPGIGPAHAVRILAGGAIESLTPGKLLVEFSASVSPQVMDLEGPGNPARAFDFATAASQQLASDVVNAIIR